MAQTGIELRLKLLEDIAAGFDLVVRNLKPSDCPELFDLICSRFGGYDSQSNFSPSDPYLHAVLVLAAQSTKAHLLTFCSLLQPDGDGDPGVTLTNGIEQDGVMAKAMRARRTLDAQTTHRDDHSIKPSYLSLSPLKLPEGHPDIPSSNTEGPRCPFASMMNESPKQRQTALSNAAAPSPPKSVPTPPETEQHDGVSKCPIRMLDERPPEEIAEYFESHKHEIPRSHEICVKRYQTNEQSIRLLDAKYGNLVNMIQGLGMKHQPLLPTKEGQEGHVEKPVSNPSVEAWAGNVPLDKEDQELEQNGEAEREGHFDRDLREIRVGESPSRPWGIPVPDLETSHAKQPPAQPDLPREQHQQAKAKLPAKTQSSPSKESFSGTPAQMVFNGPVFFGYPAEQAAVLMSQFAGNKSADPT